MALERFEAARTLVEDTLEGPEALDPSLQYRLSRAESLLARLADPDRGTGRERDHWRRHASELLKASEDRARRDAIRHSIRDADQLLADPVASKRARRTHNHPVSQGLAADDRGMSKWYGPAVLLGALVMLCFVGLAIAGGLIA